MTSYNFNVPAIIAAVIEHVLEPHKDRGWGTGPVEVPGYVVARRATVRENRQRKLKNP